MRILVLIHEYPPVGGGGGRVAQDLCQGLLRQGHEVHLLTMGYGDLPAQELQKGLQITRLACGRKEPFKAGISTMLRYVWKSFWYSLGEIRRWKPDLLHVHFAVPAGASAWALHLFTGIPYILTVHLGDVPDGVPEKTGRWFRWIFPFTPPIWRGAAATVAVSQFTRRLALQKYSLPIQVIPNGVDLQALQPDHLDANTPPLILFVGRFVPQKDPLQVVSSLAEVVDLPWQCAMIGDGALRPQVQAEIGRLGLQDRFHLPGWLVPEQVLEWYRKGDILFMPSLSEGLPVVGVQALAYGLALVLSDAGGNPELLEDGCNGALINGKNPQDYAPALRKLLSDPQALTLARQASREIAACFDLQEIVKKYADLFQGIVGRK